MAYVALKRLRFGDAWLAPGDEVPDEPGRNYTLMLRQGLVADLDTLEKSDEAHAAQVAGYKLRIRTLEGQLGDAHEEIAALRAGKPVEAKSDAAGAQESSAAEETPAEPGSEENPISIDLGEVAEMNRDDLVATAEKLGIEVPSRANKPTILGLIEAKVKGE